MISSKNVTFSRETEYKLDVVNCVYKLFCLYYEAQNESL